MVDLMVSWLEGRSNFWFNGSYVAFYWFLHYFAVSLIFRSFSFDVRLYIITSVKLECEGQGLFSGATLFSSASKQIYFSNCLTAQVIDGQDWCYIRYSVVCPLFSRATFTSSSLLRSRKRFYTHCNQVGSGGKTQSTVISFWKTATASKMIQCMEKSCRGWGWAKIPKKTAER